MLFTRHVCAFYTTHLDEYIDTLTKHDIQELFKFNLNTKNLEATKFLYYRYGNKSLLEFVKDQEMKHILKPLRFHKQKPNNGKAQTPADMLNTIRLFTFSNEYLSLSTSKGSSDEHLIQFLHKLPTVFEKREMNQQRAREEIERREMEKEDKYYVATATEVNASSKGTKKTSIQSNKIPPSYLNYQYMDLYVKQNIPSYRWISSQASQQVIRKVDASYSSFFEKIKRGMPSSPPRYNDTKKFNLMFQSDSYKIQDSKVRLSLGNETKQLLKQQHQDHDGFLYFDLAPKLRDKKICQVEVVPTRYKGNDSYKFAVVYDMPLKPNVRKPLDNISKLSIDFGVVNLATMYSPALHTPIIVSGKGLVGLNRRCNLQIDSIKSHIAQYDASTCRTIQDILLNRENRIYDFFSKTSTYIIDLCKKFSISEIVLGYNKSWKNKVNMGRKNNRSFYEIPYRKIIKMLFDKAEVEGIRVVETEESYTSKCDALGCEDIRKHDIYMGKRKQRGLFQSIRGVLVNADVNGAINILRKYLGKTSEVLRNALDTFIKNIPFSRVCEPVVVGRDLKLAPMSIQARVAERVV